jgi:hypothetical protein
MLNNVRREASRHFRNKREELGKTDLTSLQQTIRTRTPQISRRFNEFNKRYQPKTTLAKMKNVILQTHPWLGTGARDSAAD